MSDTNAASLISYLQNAVTSYYKNTDKDIMDMIINDISWQIEELKGHASTSDIKEAQALLKQLRGLNSGELEIEKTQRQESVQSEKKQRGRKPAKFRPF